MTKKNTGSSTKNKDLIWEMPEKSEDVDKDLPHDKEIITVRATISQDKNEQFFVRFPKIVSEALDLHPGFSLEFNVVAPVNRAKGFQIKSITCDIIRKGKRRKVSKDAGKKKS